MEMRMREPYVEGVAIHDGPEPCVGVREGAAKRWTGAGAGRAIEQRNQAIRGADAVFIGGRPHRWQRYRERPVGPALSENLSTHRISMCETRESPRSPVVVMAGRAARGRPRP
jgi:hypothetical protein